MNFKVVPIGETISKIARVKDEDVLARLYQIAGNHISTESAATSYDEWLASRGVKDFPAYMQHISSVVIAQMREITNRNIRMQSPKTGMKSAPT